MVMDAWVHLQTEFELPGFQERDRTSHCLLVCPVCNVLFAYEAGPSTAKKNLQIGAASMHAFAVCTF